MARSAARRSGTRRSRATDAAWASVRVHVNRSTTKRCRAGGTCWTFPRIVERISAASAPAGMERLAAPNGRVAARASPGTGGAESRDRERTRSGRATATRSATTPWNECPSRCTGVPPCSITAIRSSTNRS
ncbi:hypothetical protein GCM10009869_29910 [Amnibacterium kyonggiense]